MRRSLAAILHPLFSLAFRAQWGAVATFAAPLASGMLLGYAAHGEQAAWLIWIALVPMLMAIRLGKGYLNIGMGSYLGGLAFTLSALDWLRTIDHDDGSGPQGAREWIVLSQLCAVTWPLSTLGTRWLWVRRGVSPGFGLCLMWIVCDYARTLVSGKVLDGIHFPYLHLAQQSGIPLVVSQVADLGGMYAVTACILGANAVLASGWMELIVAARRRGRIASPWRERHVVRRVAILAAGVVAVIGYGTYRLWESPDEYGPQIIAMPSATQWGRPGAVQETLLPAVAGLPRGQQRLIVWPECAYPASLFGGLGQEDAHTSPDATGPLNSQYTASIRRTHQANFARIRRLSEALDAALVVGCVRQAFQENAWRQFNCALVVAPGDDRPRYYDKIALVPGSEDAPRLGAWLGYDRLPSYERGTRFPTFSVGASPASSYRFAVAICYDVCFPEIFQAYLSPASPDLPPDFFVIPAAEKIDRTGRLKALLMRMACLRAIETRRPVVRCVHDGYTCLIDGNGRTLSMAGQLQLSSPFFLGSVPRDLRTSLYSKLGNWLPAACVVLLMVLAVRNKRDSRDASPPSKSLQTAPDSSVTNRVELAKLNRPGSRPTARHQVLFDDFVPSWASRLMRRRIRRAFTLVELLVALAIMGLLASLMLVALGRSREMARRSQCGSNLRQIGVALQAYHTTHRLLPPAVVWAPRGEPLGFGQLPIGVIDRVSLTGDAMQDRVFANWVILLLSQLEEEALRRQFDTRLPIAHDANRARSTELAVMRCPTDAYSEVHFLRGYPRGLSGNEYARGNYAVNVGPDAACIHGSTGPDETCVGGFFVSGLPLETRNTQVWGSGLAGVNRSFRFNDVRDGLSKTVVVDEIRSGIDALDPRGAWALGQVGSSIIARHGSSDDASGPNPKFDDSDEIVGCRSLVEKLGRQQLRAENMGCYETAAEANTQAAARSMHPSGVNLLCCDGSVHFVIDTINAEIWHAIHTRNGAESADSFLTR